MSDPSSRPLSPHISVWRWHATMATSIFHRMTGVGLYAGAVVLTLWLLAAASGPEAYAALSSLLASIPGRLVLFAFTLAALFHMLNGVRHLIWDMGAGFDPKIANAVSWIIMILAVIGAVAIWWLGYAMRGGA